MAVEAAFSKAGSFLAPVLSRGNLFVKAKGQSIIQCLDPGDITAAAGRGESGLRFSIIEKALRLLLDIHEQLSQNGTSFGAADKLHNTHHQKILDGLLDLISLEGIYPHLSPGVGIPIEKRVKSVLHGGLVTRPSPAADVVSWQEGKALLSQICRQLYRILNSNGTGLGPSVQERTLVDVIAGWSELACAPRSQDEQAKDDGRMLRSLLDGFVFSFSSALSSAFTNEKQSSSVIPLLHAKDTLGRLLRFYSQHLRVYFNLLHLTGFEPQSPNISHSCLYGLKVFDTQLISSPLVYHRILTLILVGHVISPRARVFRLKS